MSPERVYQQFKRGHDTSTIAAMFRLDEHHVEAMLNRAQDARHDIAHPPERG